MNYKKKKFKIRYLIIAIIAIIILLLVSFVIKGDGKLTFVEKVFKDIANGTVNIVSAPFRYFSDKNEENKKMKEVYKTYEELKKNVDTIDLIKAENESLKKEVQKLKEVQGIKESITEYEYVLATVIKRNVGYWNNKVTINKGSSSGIEEGMVVIESGGMIGVIENVAYFSSDVKLITTPDISPKISVEVKNENKTIPGLLARYERSNNRFTIEGVSEYYTIGVGSYVYTTSYNEKIPAGVLVGKVVEVKKDNYDLSKIIQITSDVDFDNIRYVKVLKKREVKNDN